MKVCTDACVFGAHVAEHISKESLQVGNILDIGTGTGLLSLMLAQITTAKIDAIEIDAFAAAQAGENFERSPWKERLHVININALEFQPGKKYDFIITNPPFFEDALLSPDEGKNKAKHDTGLTLEELLMVSDHHLADGGLFAVLLPYHRANYFITTAQEYKLRLVKKLLLQHTTKHPWFRAVLYFTREPVMDVAEEELTIKNVEGNYTNAFTKLLKDYYLDF